MMRAKTQKDPLDRAAAAVASISRQLQALGEVHRQAIAESAHAAAGHLLIARINVEEAAKVIDQAREIRDRMEPQK